MISVLLPTTGRADMAERVVRELRTTTPGHRLEIIAAVDHDPETRDRLQPLVNLLLYEDEYRGCSNAWDDCLRACTGDPIVFAADDLRFGENWLDEALKTLALFPDGWGLVGFNDGHWNEQLSTHYLMSRQFIVEVLGGRVTWPWYKHSFNDLEVNERARRAGRYEWCRTARVYHAHWLFGDRSQDATDTRLLSQHAESEQTYHQRLQAGFPNNYAPTIKE